MIRLIVTDLDGTLVKDMSETLPDVLFDKIEQISKEGRYFAVSSGRQYASLRKMFEPVADKIYFISENGCLTCKDEKVIDKSVMRTGMEETLISDILATPGSEIIISGEKTGYVISENQDYLQIMRDLNFSVTKIPEISGFQEDYLKVSMLSYEKPETPKDILEFFRKKYSPHYQVLQTGHGWLDFIGKDCGKGRAVKNLCKKLDIKSEELAVFGDNENDVSMFELTGNSYCKESAYAHVKEKATYITKDAIHDILAL